MAAAASTSSSRCARPRSLTPEGAASWRDVSYDELFDPASSRPPSRPGCPAVSVFLRYSLGLSAWKQAGLSRWALRVNPSSGNLHPTEGYVVCGPGVAGAAAGVFHYAPDAHALDQRCVFDAAVVGGRVCTAARGQLPRRADLHPLA